MTVFTQEVPGFGEVSLRTVEPVADAPLLHRWVTEERARFWGMGDADLARVQEIYGYLDSLDTHHAYLAVLGGQPVALFQTYEPDADPVGECYPVEPGDIGVHLLIGPPADGRRPGFTGALLGVLLAYLFADPSRTRVVAEPDARNTKAHERLARAGFVLGTEVDLPEKRARLAFLTRTGWAL
ncbi:GNAT family N-acetyltransferase [Hamadaea sp. NPDC051192]|uniref:GNAT family N-acetyltransferase n=1 Tax=Hamadaea sp. NPDC051192 TaxID=3154940 RepID=UPI00344379A6